MDLKFVGIGSAFNTDYGNTNAYFEFDGDLFIIDCGETGFPAFRRALDFSRYKEIYILISHFHGDHIGGLGTLVSYLNVFHSKKPRIFYPGQELIKYLDLVGIPRNYYFHIDWLPEEMSTKIFIEPVQLPHVEEIISYGYRIQTKDLRIFYSGDSRDIPNAIVEDLKRGSLDILYQDTCSRPLGDPYHCSLELLIEKIPEEFRSKVYCMHLDKDFREDIRKAGFNYVEIDKSSRG